MIQSAALQGLESRLLERIAVGDLWPVDGKESIMLVIKHVELNVVANLGKSYDWSPIHFSSKVMVNAKIFLRTILIKGPFFFKTTKLFETTT